MRRTRVPLAVLLGAICAAGTARGQEDSNVEPAAESAFEDEVETVAPIRLRAGEGRQVVEVVVHLWGGPAEDAAQEPAPRRLEVAAETPPPFVRDLRILQAAPRREGEAADAPLRFVPGSTVTFAPEETARPLRLTFDLAQDASAADDGLAAGDLVVVITATDPEVVPRRRRLVLPLEFRPGGELPETTGAKVQMYIRTSEKVEGGRGIMRFMSKSSFHWEDPTPENAHPYCGFEPYVRLTWEEATDDVLVIARGSVTGGIPPIETKIDRSGGGGMNPFHARFRGGHSFNILLDVGKGSAGTFNVSGKLLAFPRSARTVGDTEDLDESSAVAVLPFSTSLTYAVPPITAEGKVRLSRGSRYLSGSISVGGVQPGRRIAKVELGGGTMFAMLGGGGYGGGGGAKVRLYGQDSAPATATISFANYGQTATVTVPLEREVSGQRSPEYPDRLARYERRLAENRADPRNIKYVGTALRDIATHYRDQYRFEPEPWIRTCNEWFAQLGRVAEALGNPNWEGYRNRTVAAEVMAKERSAQLHERLRGRIYKAGDALQIGLIDVAQPWIDASAGEVATVVTDPDQLRSVRISLAQGYRKLAEETFRVTGNIDAARAIWQRHNEYRKQNASNLATFRPTVFPFEPAPEYR